MKTRRFALGPWRPDLPPLRNQSGVKAVQNVMPIAGGWGRFPVSVETSTGALASEPVGALRGQFSDGSNIIVAATATGLFRLLDDGTWSDVTRASGAYTAIFKKTWSSDQFGDSLFFTNRSNPLQAFNTSTSTRFEDVEKAPKASHLAVAENFLFLADIVDDEIGVARDGVAWSALGNPYYWPSPSSDDATAVLSGRQVLEGNGGVLKEVISGSEVVALFQEEAIHRADFVGNDIAWQFTRVITDHGMLVPHAGVAFERMILYLARDGFRVFNYTSSENVGKGVVNDFFFDSWDRDFEHTLSMVKDPTSTRIFIAYTSNASIAGEPDALLVWDYALNQWGFTQGLDAYWQLCLSAPIAASLDSPGTAEDPDRIGGTPSDTDPPGDESFDDLPPGSEITKVGHLNSNLRMAEFRDDRDTSSGYLVTADFELEPGRRSLVNGVRVQYEGDSGSQTLEYVAHAKSSEITDSPYWSAPVPEDADGEFHFRSDGRFHQFKVNLADFDSVGEIDVSFRPNGTR